MIVEKLGRYELRGTLGRGAMGVVHRAYDTVLEREVALKTMSGPGGDTEEDTLRFLREARAAGGLHHPNIVTIHELGREEGHYFIAMELMEGTDLEKVIKGGQPPPLPRRLEIVAQLCAGLDFAHRSGIVHRDVKPANVFLCSDGRVKILDFGVAKIASSDATRTGMVIGTVDYMSPEQIRAEKNLDGRSDIFSAGVILYELLFGRKPFAADHLGAILHRVLHEEPAALPAAEALLGLQLGHVLRRALDKRREARFQTAREMAAELRKVIRGLTDDDARSIEGRIAEAAASGALDDAARAGGVAEAAGTVPSPSGATTPVEQASAAAGPRGRRRWSILAVSMLVAGGALVAPRIPGWIRGGTPPPTPAAQESRLADRASGAEAGDPAHTTGTPGVATPAPTAGTDGVASGKRVAREDRGPDGTLPIEHAGGAEPSTAKGRRSAGPSGGEDSSAAARSKTPSSSGVDAASGETVEPETPAAEDGTRGPSGALPFERTGRGTALVERTQAPTATRGTPAVAAPGSLELRVMPWAKVVAITNLDSGEIRSSSLVTPARLELPAGRYRLRFDNPHASRPLEVEVTVTAGQARIIRRSMPGLDESVLLHELLARDGAAGNER